MLEDPAMTSPLTPIPPPPKSEPVEVVTPARIRERRALGVLALIALGFLVRLAMPVGIGLFLGALLAFTLEPLYGKLRRRQMNAGPAALICALGATLSVSATVLALSTLLVTGGITLLGTVRAMLAPGAPLRVFVDGASGRLAALHVNVEDLSAKLESEALSLGTRIASVAAEVAGTTFSGLLDALPS